MDQPQMLVALGFMITAAVTVIFYGSRRNLAKLKASASGIEVMSSSDAASFPIAGSLALFTLYFAFKLVPRDYLNALLSIYLCMTAVFCLGGFAKPIVGANPVTGLVCIGLGACYVYSKNWIVNNVLAIAIGVVAIENVQLGSFVTSAILLCGLFLYDIFWVFGTDVMVTVATNVDGPIKLLFPQTIFGDHAQKSLLGLGDIVIPGFFIAQTFVFSKLSSRDRGSFYFNVAMIAYFLSLVNTMVVMVFFKHAQPALLYIVPWLLVSTALAAIVKGEVGSMLNFDTDTLVLSLHGKADVAAAKVEAEQQQSKGASEFIWSMILELFGLDEVPKKENKKSSSADGKKKGTKELQQQALPPAASSPTGAPKADASKKVSSPTEGKKASAAVTSPLSPAVKSPVSSQKTSKKKA